MQPTRDSALAWWTSSVVACLLGLMVPGGSARAADDPAAERFQEEIQPILMEYCYGCHGMGSKKGDVSFEELETDAAALQKRDLWWTVLKNVRSGIMPPAGKPRPSDKEKLLLADWIKRGVFKIDPQDPDPGRVTIRRLNRVEYRNTIHDLMGIDFKTEEEFPPDDTGYGFDTIGDVLCVSPLLLEKYMQAAESIVAVAVPKLSKVISEQKMRGSEFRAAEGEANGDRLTFYKEANVSHTFKVEQEGDYRLLFEVAVNGDFDFDPGRCTVSMKLDDWEVLSEAYRWQDHKTFRYELKEHLSPGEHPLAFELTPLTKLEDKRTSVDFRVVSVQIEGPLEERFWTHPKNYDRFFSRDEPPTSTMERRQYAREILSRFTKKAFRRPVDDRTIDRLVWIAEDGYGQPGKRFEEGVAHAIVAVLASPRFLFRVEEPEATQAASPHPLIDEYALASRLSYFLWSTMPDDELVGLAERGELRKNLGAQVKRMLADPRSKEMIENFTGQWLQVRDIEGISIDARWVLARDNGEEKELKQAIEDFKARLAKLQEEKKAEAQNKDAAQNKDQAQAKAQRPNRGRLFARPAVELDGPLRTAMRRESEMFFANIVHEDRSILDLIDSDYTFVNEKLAKFYGLPEVKGPEMRKVTLPKESPRGGVLTQGAVLAVTSNPTRTSPVKRGQFILDNVLGTPAPPPPPDIPLLEEAEKLFQDREPTLRETLELHRSKPLCNACHSRMDPLGLALENFNAMGMWREKERGQAIDAVGKLISGESFHDIRDVKRILASEHRQDFYRCLTEKLLTYALGRGLDSNDVQTVDDIIERLEREDGRFSALLTGIIESAPFQKRRNVSAVAAAQVSEPTAAQAPSGEQP